MKSSLTKRAFVADIYIDLDGPILDVKKRQYLVYSKIVFSLKGAPISESKYWNYKRRKEPLENILKKSAIGNKAAQFRKKWRDLIEKKESLKLDSVFLGSARLLNKLSQKHDLILVTLRKSKKNLFWQLNNLKIKKYFIKILSSGAKEGSWIVKYHLIRKQKPSICSYLIGDTEIDILAAKELGFKTIAVSCGIRNRGFLKQFKPDYLTGSLRQAVAILK